MRRRFLILFSCAVALCAQTDDFEKALSGARQLLTSHKDAEAAQAGLKVIQIKPERWEGYLLVASAMCDKKSYAEALPFLYRAFVLAPADRQPTIEQMIEEAVVGKLSKPPAAARAATGKSN